MSYQDRDLYTVPVSSADAIYLMCQGETLLMLSNSSPEGYVYIFYKYGMFNIVSPGKTSQGTTLQEKDLILCTFYKMEDSASIIKSPPLKGANIMDHPRIIIQSQDSESIETFIFRLHQAAKDLGRPVDGKFDFSYIGDVKPEDDPVNIIKAYRAAARFAFEE